MPLLLPRRFLSLTHPEHGWLEVSGPPPYGSFVLMADERVRIIEHNELLPGQPADPSHPIPPHHIGIYRLPVPGGNPFSLDRGNFWWPREYPCLTVGYDPINKTGRDYPDWAVIVQITDKSQYFEYALWEQDWRTEGRMQNYQINGVVQGRVFPDGDQPLYIVELAGSPKPSDVSPIIAPVPEIIIIPGPEVLPTLADGPTEGMDIWESWRDGRLNGFETSARYCETSLKSPITGELIRQLKYQ